MTRRNGVWCVAVLLGLALTGWSLTSLAFAASPGGPELTPPAAREAATPHSHDAVAANPVTAPDTADGSPSAPSAADAGSTWEHPCAHAKAALAREFADLPPAAQALAEDDPTDAIHYSIEIEPDFDAKTITGTTTLTIMSRVDGLTTFDFRLVDSLQITSITCNGVAVSTTRLTAATVQAQLDRSYNAGETFALVVQYSGPPRRYMVSFNFETHAGEPVVFTISQTNYAFTWFPNKDDNRDKLTADLAVIVPTSMTAVANGTLQSVTPLAGDRQRWAYASNYPVPTQLIYFAATNYVQFGATYSGADGDLPLTFYVYPENDTPARREDCLDTINMLAIFTDRFGPYPFPDDGYGIYELKLLGGIEHQARSGQGIFSRDVTAHELAHQWWGDLVTCATWQDLWLNEGFATYGEAIFLESLSPQFLIAGMQLRRPLDRQPAFAYNYGYPSSAYRRGAWTLHMLRHMVGDARFWSLLADYRASFAFGSATTDEFRMVAEATYAGDLVWFFDQWIYREGLPDYRYNWRLIEVNGQQYAEVSCTQSQPTEEPTFWMPVELEFSANDGSNVQRQTVWNDARSEHFLLPVSGLVQQMTFDPDMWLLDGSRQTTPFVEGPPKLVSASPMIDAVVASQNAASLRVAFHKGVTIADGDIELRGEIFGVIPTTLDYNATTKVATITPQSLLKPDHYTLTVRDTSVDVASQQALDGEIGPDGPPGGVPVDNTLLPSGDGEPGGDALLPFTVGPQGDLTGDGVTNMDDLTALFAAWQTPAGDLNGDAATDLSDLAVMFASWLATVE